MIKVIYEDAQVIGCIKPAGIISEDGGIPDMLAEQLGIKRVYCVHRLDKPVGGVMVYAKDGRIAARLTEAFSAHAARKSYLAVITGTLVETEGTLKDLLYHDARANKTYTVKTMRKGVKEAELSYKVLKAKEGRSLLSVELHTGRSHQIRVQFASRKHPLEGDGRYGSKNRDVPLALYSKELSFRHPVGGKLIDLSADMPCGGAWDMFGSEM